MALSKNDLRKSPAKVAPQYALAFGLVTFMPGEHELAEGTLTPKNQMLGCYQLSRAIPA